MTWERERKEFPKLVDYVVNYAVYDLNDKGYDVLRIEFTNGKALVVTEEGQAGWFSCKVEPNES